jgi:hypothetical protein
MTVKLSTTINNIEKDVINSENKQLLIKFFDFMKRAGTSEKYQNNNLKAIIAYLENELWEKDDLLTIIKYESYKRNKAILALLWDLDARPHELTLLKIKHIRLRDKYGEGEIPHEAKTGTGPILLTTSFPYVRDWLNEHPFKNEPNSRLICNLINGSPITADNIDKVMKQLQINLRKHYLLSYCDFFIQVFNLLEISLAFVYVLILNNTISLDIWDGGP